MQSNTWQYTIAAAITGTGIGIYKALNAAPFLQSVLLTAVGSAVSCIVSFCLQRLIKKLKQ